MCGNRLTQSAKSAKSLFTHSRSPHTNSDVDRPRPPVANDVDCESSASSIALWSTGEPGRAGASPEARVEFIGETATPRSDPCDTNWRAHHPVAGVDGADPPGDVAVSEVVSSESPPAEHPVDGAVVGVCSWP